MYDSYDSGIVIVIVIVIFKQEVHSVQLIFSGALDKSIQYRYVHTTKQIYKNKHTCKHTTRNNDKTTIKNLNNNYEKRAKWQPQLQWTLNCSIKQFRGSKNYAFHSS